MAILGVVLAVWSLPSAHAQTPLDPTVDVEVGRPDGDAGVERVVEVAVRVTNTSPGTGTPLDLPMQVSLSVSGTPAGWAAGVEPSSFELSAGQSQDATLRVTVTTGAVQGEAQLTVRALIRAGLPGQLSLTGEDAATVTVRHDPSTTREVVESLGAWFWAILAAAFILAALAAYFAYGRLRRRIEITTAVAELRLRPGTTGVFPLTIVSLDSKALTAVFHVDGARDDWVAFLPSSELELEPQETVEWNLMVTPPSNARSGSKRTIAVRADAGAGRPAAVAVAVRVDDAP